MRIVALSIQTEKDKKDILVSNGASLILFCCVIRETSFLERMMEIIGAECYLNLRGTHHSFIHSC